MLKKVFGWEYSGFLIPCFYSLGFASWKAALIIDPYNLSPNDICGRFLFIAAVLFAAGFVWSLGWLWTHKFFTGSSNKHRRRHSDRHPNADVTLLPTYLLPERRRRTADRPKRTKLRLVAIACSILLLISVGTRLFRTYKIHYAPNHNGQLDIFLWDTDKTGAPLPLFFAKTGLVKSMAFAGVYVPTRSLVLSKDQTTVRVAVVVRNVSTMKVRSAHVKIDSDMPIRAFGGGLSSISDTAIGGYVSDLGPFSQSSEDHVFLLDIIVLQKSGRAGLLISVEGKEIKPYAAALNLAVSRRH